MRVRFYEESARVLHHTHQKNHFRIITTTIHFDDQLQKEVDRLKKIVGATTNAALVQKALSLAALAADQADDNRSVTISRHKTRTPIRASLAT